MRKLSVLLVLALLAAALTACGSSKNPGSGADTPAAADGPVPHGIYQFVYMGDAEGSYVQELNERKNAAGQTVRLLDEMYGAGDCWYFKIDDNGSGFLTDTASDTREKAVTFTEGSFSDDAGNTFPYKKDGDRFWYEESNGNWAVMEKASQGTIDLLEAGKGGSVPLGEAEPGDLVCLGTYDQIPGNDYAEPIYWRVLDKNDNNLLLLSEKLLDAFSYKRVSEEGTEATPTWKKSSVRRFLNEEFIENTFSDVEEALLITTRVKSPEYNDVLSEYWNFKKKPYSAMKKQKQQKGAVSEDKVFLLSVGEVTRYLADDPSAQSDANAPYPFSELPVQQNRIAYVTRAAAENNVGNFDPNTLQGAWMTRTLCNLNGGNDTGVVYVTGEGQFFNYYTNVPMLIRPAMWVSGISVEP